ncbi:MAG TPA: sulfatase [Myxococcota bacterium]|nr:sulfatase [Myxococcota bacterium]
MRIIPALVVASLVAPTWIAANGGADVDVLGHRIELYRVLGPALALFGAAVVAALPPANGRRRWLHGAVLLLAALSALVLWGARVDTDWLRVHGPGRLAQAAALLAALALGLARGRIARASVLGGLLPGLALGALVLLGVRAADRADLDRRIAGADAHATSPDVILILVDTLRADALGAYGADPSPSPFLDAFAEGSVVFERAVSQAQWTAPSVSSLLSSLYPSSFLWDEENLTHQRLIRLPAGIPWLPAVLADAGYHTAAFVKNPLLQGGTRFGEGFQIHEWVRGDTAEIHSGRQLVDAVLRWGDAMADHRAAGDGGSFFTYVHFMDPHALYQPPPGWMPDAGDYDGPVSGGVKTLSRLAQSEAGPTPEDLARVRDLYRGEVAYLDSELARLHDGLAARGLWSDDTVVVLIADHGEQFFEHGAFFHGHVNWENLHVPFVFRAPGIRPRRIAGPVALLDLAPTLLDWLGIDAPEAMEGHSLVAQLRGEPLPRRFVMTERVGRGSVRATGPEVSLVEGRENWFEDASGAVIPIDAVPPEESARLAELREAQAAWRERPLPRIEGLSDETPALRPDADTENRLRALGYLE